jgi:hypothetical protein
MVTTVSCRQQTHLPEQTPTLDWRGLALATLFLSRIGSGIDAEVVRSTRGWARVDAMP